MLNLFGDLTCVQCGAPLPPSARFCMACGAAQSTADGRMRAAQSTTDGRMRAAHLHGERKLITVLFADVVDSTGLAEGMDPEDWAAIMNRAFERLTPVIAAYGGTIARLMGDALLAFFGAPTAHEDDPLRAVEAARELLVAARALSCDVEPLLGRPFALRIGINTGWVVLGDVGSDLKFEYTAMGDTVNVAARLQAAALPMTALLTEDTYQHVAERVGCRDRGAVSIRGRTQPVRAFELEPSTGDGPVMQAPMAHPFVGRLAELEQVRVRLAALADGRGGLLRVLGDAGIGKTRLLAEARRLHGAPLAAGSAVRWLQLQAPRPLPGRAPALAPFLSLIDRLHEPEQTDFDPAISADQVDVPAVALQVCGVVERLLEAGPVVLVLDDVQWLDLASTVVLRSLARLATQRALLVCAVGRPDARLPGRFAVGDRIALAPLDAVDSARLVDGVLAAEGAAWPGLAELVYASAEGNPLYTERLVLDWLRRTPVPERTTSGPGLTVPHCLQQLVAARLDCLDPEVRDVLRLASVIGRSVGEHVLRTLADAPERLEACLAVLERLQLLDRQVVGADRIYRFTHALDWQIACAGVLSHRKAELLVRLDADVPWARRQAA